MISPKEYRAASGARRAERETKRVMIVKQQDHARERLADLERQAPELAAAVTEAQAAVRVAEEQLRLARVAASPLQERDGLQLRLGVLDRALDELAAADADDL